MKNRRTKRNHFIKLAQAGGVGLFLIAGLSGCEDKSECIQNAKYAPDVQQALDECNGVIKTTSSSGASSGNGT